MITNLKAIYAQGVLRLKEPLSLPDGTQVDIAVTSHEENTRRAFLRQACRRFHGPFLIDDKLRLP